jgi:hypothetical protein
VGSVNAAKGKMVIVAGLSTGEGEAAHLLKASNRSIPEESEALSVWKTNVKNKDVWVMNGFDDRGLMYALLDVADRVSWSTDPKAPLSQFREITEKPDAKERAVSIYTMNRAYWETRFYDQAYWAKYLDMLARNRFNSLVVIFGYENGGFLQFKIIFNRVFGVGITGRNSCMIIFTSYLHLRRLISFALVYMAVI